MLYLLVVSVIWAFSFGLIKHSLSGIDSNLISCCRMFLSMVVFLPFLRLRDINRRLALKLIIIGMIQYGLMYLTYIYLYQFLKSYQVAIFTVFTPVYVTLISDILEKRFHPVFLITAFLAVIGTAIIVNKQVHQAELRLGERIVLFC